MQIDIFTGNLSQREADCLVVGVHDGGVLCDAAAALDKRAGGAISRFLKRGDFPGRRRDDELTLFKSVGTALEDLTAARLVLLGAQT